MKRENTDEFMREDFSVGEYLSKILADTSGECTRIKDSHVRLLSKHTEALAEELMDKSEEVEKSLKTLDSLSRECKRIAKELPELFLPLLEYEAKPAAMEERRKFKHEIQTLKGGKSLLAPARSLKYKEHVEMVVDREKKAGKILVSNDIIVICIKKDKEYEIYNALLLQETEASLDEEKLTLSLPPVFVEVTSGEHSNLNKLHAEIEKVQRKRERHEHREEDTEEDVERAKEEYNRYLLRIGKIDQIEDPSLEELEQHVKQAYSATGEWTYARKIMKLVRKKNPLQAFRLFCSLVEEDAVEKAAEIVHRREKQEKIVEKLSKLLRKQMETVLELFEEEKALSGNISLYLEHLHVSVAEIYIKHLMTVSDSEETVEETLAKMKKTFRYEGYSYEYTVDMAQKIRREVLRKKYAFSKKIVQNVFEHLA